MGEEKTVVAETPLRSPLMLLSTACVALAVLFSTVALAGLSTNSDSIINAPWWYGKVNGNPLGFGVYGACIKTYNKPCSAPSCLALSNLLGAGNVPIANRLCSAYQIPAGQTYTVPSGFLYQYNTTQKCAFYSTSMAAVIFLAWLLCLVKFFHGFMRRNEVSDSMGRKVFGLVLLFLSWLFGVIALGIFDANCAPQARNLLGDVDEGKGRMGAGSIGMVIAVIFWGIAFICEALVPAGSGTFCGSFLDFQAPPAGSRKLPTTEVVVAKDRDTLESEKL
jgi:hypothetical protein